MYMIFLHYSKTRDTIQLTECGFGGENDAFAKNLRCFASEVSVCRKTLLGSKDEILWRVRGYAVPSQYSPSPFGGGVGGGAGFGVLTPEKRLFLQAETSDVLHRRFDGCPVKGCVIGLVWEIGMC